MLQLCQLRLISMVIEAKLNNSTKLLNYSVSSSSYINPATLFYISQTSSLSVRIRHPKLGFRHPTPDDCPFSVWLSDDTRSLRGLRPPGSAMTISRISLAIPFDQLSGPRGALNSSPRQICLTNVPFPLTIAKLVRDPTLSSAFPSRNARTRAIHAASTLQKMYSKMPRHNRCLQPQGNLDRALVKRSHQTVTIMSADQVASPGREKCTAGEPTHLSGKNLRFG